MKYKLLTLASATAMLAACSDSSLSSANDEIKETATVVITTYDNLTKLPLEDVSVYYRHDDKTKKTDSTGTIVWKNVEIGTQWFDFQYEGYAYKRVPITVSDNITNDVARVDDVNEEVPMYELGVEAKGQFFYTDAETGDKIPAANVTVYATYDDASIYPNEVYTKTDSLGFYSFTNMASNVGFKVATERFTIFDKDSLPIVYEVASIESVNERKGVSKDLKPVAAAIASLDPVLLSSNLKSLEKKDAIKLVFSEVLNADSLKSMYVSVKSKTNNRAVAVSLSLDEDGKTVIVKPTSGAWVDGDDYTISYNVWTTLTKNANDDIDFMVGKIGVPGQIKGLKIDVNDDGDKQVKPYFNGSYTYETKNDKDLTNDLTFGATIDLIWNSIEKNVDKYMIYVRGNADKDADYVLIDSTASNLDTTITIDVNKLASIGTAAGFDYPLNAKQSKSVSVIVLAKNSAGEANAAEAKPLAVKFFDDYAKVKLNDMLTNEYYTTASIDGVVVYSCTDKDISKCDVANPVTAETAIGDYYLATVSIKVEHDDDVEDVPNGFDVYYVSGDEYFKLSGTSLAYNNPHSPFCAEIDYGTDPISCKKVQALKYDGKATKRYEFRVVPYFMNFAGVGGSFKISQANLEASNGVLTASGNIQSKINEL